MNQRIRELHTKATEWALDNYPPPVNTFMWEDLRNEKFAELIVRECGNYMNSRIPGNIEVSATVAKMKQHLGVDK